MLLIFGSKNHVFKRLKVSLIVSLIVFQVLVVFAATDSKTTSAASQSRRTSFSQGLEKAFDLFYSGNIGEAEKIVNSHLPNEKARQFKVVLDEFQQLQTRRVKTRLQKYEEQLEELKKFEQATLKNEPNDPNNINDPNNLTKALSEIAKASEFADEVQQNQLLENPFVKQVIDKSKDRAAQYEAEGKWLESYVSCYSWLSAIDPDNKEHDDYSDRLIEKAGIVSSFQDSPCETSKERYENITKNMFTRSIDVLHFNYVRIIDYRQMAIKCLNRCELLADVIKLSPVVREALYDNKEKELKSEIAAWLASLKTIYQEVEQSPTGITKGKFVTVFEDVLKINQATLKIPEEVLIAQYAEAAYASLDPHTTMIWPKQTSDFKRDMTNQFTGIGIEISKQKGELTVGSLLLDTPAFYSGLDAGDVITAVDGLETKDMTLHCAVKHITGPEGTDVTLTVRSPGSEETREITITRASIKVPTIRGWQRVNSGDWKCFIDQKNKIALVRIVSQPTGFDERTAGDLEKLLKELEKDGLNGLILDLRNNSGGLLDSAVEVVDKFIDKGLVVKTQPRWGFPEYRIATEEATHPDFPLVILINSGSASASEIVAGALADEKYNRAILVGERTHGKGSVQGITALPGGGAQLKYTMAYYHLPSDQRVESRDRMEKLGREDWGVGPDVKIELRSDELRKLYEVRRDNDVLVRADHEENGKESKKHTIEETLESDPQLAAALLVVKAQLVEKGKPVVLEKTNSKKSLSKK